MNKKNNIVLYFINWNDSFYIPFIYEHYSKFCSHVIMYDNHSSDNSVQIAKSFNFEVRTFGVPGVLNDQYYLDVKNHCWKEQRNKNVDYVIVCDADEFLSIDVLEGTAPRVHGFQMISDYMPINKINEIKTGVPDQSYSKQIIFNPDQINEINYVHGCHKNHIQGNIIEAGACALLHYRMIGGIDRLILRHNEYRKRLSTFNKKHKMGIHYEHDNQQRINEFNTLKSKSIELW